MDLIFPPAFWAWVRWRDNGKIGPRPKGVPDHIPASWKARYLLHRGLKPKPVYSPSMFSELGGFVAQAGSFPADTPSAREFAKEGGKWLSVQFGDPDTDPGNREQFSTGWAAKWRAAGVKVGAWWRVEQVGIPIPNTPPVDFLVPNPEQPHEMLRTEGILRACRASMPSAPLGCITVGKALAFPTGLMVELDAHIILECFLETPAADTTVTNSVNFWLDSGVPRDRIHPSLLFKTGYATPIVDQTAEARALGVRGLSAFTAENTPATAWKVMT